MFWSTNWCGWQQGISLPSTKLERNLKFVKKLVPSRMIATQSFWVDYAYLSIKLLPTLVPTGLRIRLALLRVLQKYPDVTDACLVALGSHDAPAGPSDMIAFEAGRAIAYALMTNVPNKSASLLGIVAELSSAWRVSAGDWDDQPERWLIEGAPWD